MRHCHSNALAWYRLYLGKWSIRADRLAVVNDVGKLPARCGRDVEYVFVDERHNSELEEGVDLQPVAVVVGDAEKGG